MQELPHVYTVTANAGNSGEITLESPGVAALPSQPPAEFGGPGDQWSPESLLVAAVADCFVLTFRAIARASKMPYNSLHVVADGILDRVERDMKFTKFRIDANLTVNDDVDAARAERLLHKAEQGCLITNSMTAEIELTCKVTRA